MMRFLVPIAFPSGPSLVKFHPNYTANVLAGSKDGSLLLNDLIDSSPSRCQYITASISGYLTSLNFSSSGEMIALGDSFGEIQFWQQRENAKINAYSRESVYYDPPSIQQTLNDEYFFLI